MRTIILLAISSCLFVSCSFDNAFEYIETSFNEAVQANQADTVKYIALGDSYTVGTGVPFEDRWPELLTDTLDVCGFVFDSVKYVAQNGWNTSNLLTALNPSLLNETYDLVSVMIGVNNQFWNSNMVAFKNDLRTILNFSISLAGGDTCNILLVNIPDWGTTPVGQNIGDPALIAASIENYNAAIDDVANEYGLPVCQVYPISKLAAGDSTMVAPDGLHFSGKMHKLWSAEMFLKVKNILS